MIGFMILPVWLRRRPLELECPQKNRTDEQEDGGDGEHIHPQGQVHGSASLVGMVDTYHKSEVSRRADSTGYGRKCVIRHASASWRGQPIDRAPQKIAMRKNSAVQYACCGAKSKPDRLLITPA
jgi:hypothetical protein